MENRDTIGSGKYGYGAIPPRVNGYGAGPKAFPSSGCEIRRGSGLAPLSEGRAAVATSDRLTRLSWSRFGRNPPRRTPVSCNPVTPA